MSWRKLIYFPSLDGLPNLGIYSAISGWYGHTDLMISTPGWQLAFDSYLAISAWCPTLILWSQLLVDCRNSIPTLPSLDGAATLILMITTPGWLPQIKMFMRMKLFSCSRVWPEIVRWKNHADSTLVDTWKNKHHHVMETRDLRETTVLHCHYLNGSNSTLGWRTTECLSVC